MNTGTITIELSGPLERALSKTVVEVDSPASLTLGELFTRIGEQYPEARRFLGCEADPLPGEGPLPGGLLVIRDSAVLPSRLETTVNVGDQLALMPMISGGAVE